MKISLVPVGQISGVLPALLPYLAKSGEWTRGRAVVDDILRFVLNGQMQLWGGASRWADLRSRNHGDQRLPKMQNVDCAVLRW